MTIDLDQLFRQRFINYLILNTSFSNKIGLLDGKSATVLYFYLNKSKFEADWIDHIAYTHLEELLSQISVFTPLSFGSGLSGLGVMLEFLRRQEYIDGNVTELLENIEPRLLGLVYGGGLKQADLAGGLSGLGLYFLHRINSSSPCDTLLTLRYREAVIACVDQLWILHRAGELLSLNMDLFDGLSGVISFLQNVVSENMYVQESEALLLELSTILLEKLSDRSSLLRCAPAYYLLSATAIACPHWHGAASLTKEVSGWFTELRSAELETLDITSPFQLLLTRMLAERRMDEQVIGWCNNIIDLLYTSYKDIPLNKLFPFDRKENSVPVGISSGVTSAALPLHSIESGDYSWLSVFGIKN